MDTDTTINNTDVQVGDTFEAEVTRLTRALCSWYVRKDNKFHSINNLSTRHSRVDVEQVAVRRLADEFCDIEITAPHMREVFKRAISGMHSDLSQTIPVWDGRIICQPASEERVIWTDGAVAVNRWRVPEYRKLKDINADYGLIQTFLGTAMSNEAERIMFLDWLSWCLQHEDDKPTWAPFLFSKAHGTGKSTLCLLASKLFGQDNTATQNNVDKLTSQFNMPILQSKLVVSEELQIKQGSKAGNALKTYLTEDYTLAEMKGVDAQQIQQYCCFLFTTNHMPTWMEAGNRRYYVIDMDHDGSNAGPNTEAFSELAKEVRLLMEDERAIAALYRALMERRQANEFNAKSLNLLLHSTPLMKRIQATSVNTVASLLEEHLLEKGLFAVPDMKVADIVTDKLRQKITSTRHLMGGELGWTLEKVKWNKCAYARGIWVKEGYNVDNGYIYGQEGYKQSLADHLKVLELNL
jgi:hypothetical protein